MIKWGSRADARLFYDHGALLAQAQNCVGGATSAPSGHVEQQKPASPHSRGELEEMGSTRVESDTLNHPAPPAGMADLPQQRRPCCYSVYGLRLRTAIALSVPQLPEGSGYDIDLIAGDTHVFEESLKNVVLKSDWAQAHRLPERWLYARIEAIVDFLVSPEGSEVFYRPLSDFSSASFETYVLGILMKAVLIKKDIPSLHASAVVIGGRAVAFLGPNGVGKSSLAAAFVSAGYTLLTDDLLRLNLDDTRVWAYPGPAFLKLLPDARQSLAGFDVGVPMDPAADKWLFALPAELQCRERVSLAAVYSLIGPDGGHPDSEVAIHRLTPREALAEVVYGTHMDRVVEADRATSFFDAAKRITSTVVVRRLACPWNFARLQQVRSAVLEDVQRL